MPHPNHRRALEMEHACLRDPRLGFEPDGRYGFLRLLAARNDNGGARAGLAGAMA